MNPATSFLGGLALRRAGLAVAAAATVAGGGRLVQGELRLRDTTARAEALDRRLEEREAEALRAAALELELAQTRREAGRVADALGAARGRLAAVEAEATARAADLAAARAALEAAAAEQAALAGARDELTRSLAAARGDAESAREAAAALGRRLSGVEEALRAARTEHERAAEAARRAELGLADTRGRLLEAEQEAWRQAEARAALAVRLEEATARADGAAKALEQARARLAAWDETRGRLEAAGVNLARVTGDRPMPKMRGMILQVDEAAVPPVVLVDLGAAAGLEVGDVLHVVRSEARLARLEVDDVQPRFASARVVQGERGLRLKPGDAVLSP